MANDVISERQRATTAGLDALELGPKRTRAALGGRIWRSAWPKLLAIAIVVLIWQIGRASCRERV